MVLSGPSGVGKDALLSRLREMGVPFHRAITATTRPRHANEVNGLDYLFMTEAEFLDKLERGELLEHARVYDHYYGVPKEPVRQALAQGLDVLVRTDNQGAFTIKGKVPEAVIILLVPGSLDELAQRLRARGRDSPTVIEQRLAAAAAELAQAPRFDYVVVNADGRLGEAAAQVAAIITAEKCRAGRRPVTL